MKLILMIVFTVLCLWQICDAQERRECIRGDSFAIVEAEAMVGAIWQNEIFNKSLQSLRASQASIGNSYR